MSINSRLKRAESGLIDTFFVTRAHLVSRAELQKWTDRVGKASIARGRNPLSERDAQVQAIYMIMKTDSFVGFDFDLKETGITEIEISSCSGILNGPAIRSIVRK
ncbi:MAG: hypothetical protein IIB00_03000 [candidate division Zixibacteria bacterium]|nr:hypothetical protein [candidate division Zixibacteria bacterium]